MTQSEKPWTKHKWAVHSKKALIVPEGREDEPIGDDYAGAVAAIGWPWKGRTEDEAYEIAHIIAASPETTEALEKLLDKYVTLVNSGDAGFWNPEEVPEVIAARAALLKANGGKP